jgi:RimJ/RimL family protein N-acetyltransferase
LTIALQLSSQRWGARFQLATLDARRHAARLYPLFHGVGAEFVWDYLRDGPFPSLKGYQDHLEVFQRRADVLAFVVKDVSKGSLVGKLLLIKVAPETSAVEIAYVLFAPDVHGSGAAMAAVGALADHVFLTLGKTACHWKCDKLNGRSASFAAKMGFSLISEISADFRTKGRLRDTLEFAQSRDEWLVKRRSLCDRYI